MSDVHVFPTYDALSRAAAQHVAAHIQTVLRNNETYALALAGGSTPERTYELLASGFPRIPWERVHIFWGDERFVPSASPHSNEHMARRTLLSRIDVPFSNVHPIPTDAGSPDAAANRYEDTLRNAFAEQDHTFDLALLGIGSDGHTASLFPENTPSLDDTHWVRAVRAPERYDIRDRITCTLPVLNAATEAVFIVAGSDKREAVRRAQRSDTDVPAAHVNPRERLTWFLDPEAAPETDPTE